MTRSAFASEERSRCRLRATPTEQTRNPSALNFSAVFALVLLSVLASRLVLSDRDAEIRASNNTQTARSKQNSLSNDARRAFLDAIESAALRCVLLDD
jgi:hypothetical protein